MSLTRRTLLTSAGLLAGAPLLSKTTLAIEPALPRSPQLSPAVLGATAQIVGQTTARIHLRTAVRGDLERAADAIELLRQHLAETAFDAEMRALAGKANVAEFDTEAIQKRVFAEVWKYDRAISVDEIQIPRDLSAGVLELRAHGLDRGLKQISKALRGAAWTFPAAYWARPGDFMHYQPHILRVQDSPGSFCDTAGFWINMLAGGLGVVALFGCTDPVTFIICPAIGLIASILGLVAFAQWIWC